jgi:hypothetical protein
MKPIMILPPEVMSPEDIKLLNENGLCVVIVKEPAKVRFVDPIPPNPAGPKSKTPPSACPEEF